MRIPEPGTPAGARRFARGDLAVELGGADGRMRLVLRAHGAVLARIGLGITVDGADLGAGAEVLGSTATEIHEEYTSHLGKAAGRHEVHHDEHRVQLRSGGTPWAVVLRLAADGIAFRYELPGTPVVLGEELTRVELPGAVRCWVLDYQSWYETPRYGADLDALAPGGYGFPVLVRGARGAYLLLTESGIDGRSSGAHAEFDGGGFRVVAADDGLDVEPGHRTPWRVLITGGLDGIVRSQLVDELAPACPPDALPPRPGRGAWSWWSNRYSGAYLEVQKRFADFAAEQGWEHLLVDCGWDAAWVPELVSYASARGVQVHLWSAWSDLDGPVALRKLALWRSWGVAGIKVDFMESESRERYRWYDAIIAEAGRAGLMVNFHGSVIPRGWARTHPHVVGYEAVRGAEYYVFYGQPLTASHNVILPFTRNVVGSMDYTPVAFSAPGRETSEGHELALGVVFESGITHFADDPDEYRARPDAAALLAELPPVWHETRLLDGDPDSHAVIARRHGDRWFVGGISSRPEASELRFDPRELVDGPAGMWLAGDADGGLASTHRDGVEGEVVVPVAARGGFAAVLAPAGVPLRSPRGRSVRPAPRVEEAIVVLTGGTARISADAEAARVAPGWRVERVGEGRWEVAAEGDPAPGEIAVVAFEGPGHGGVPVVAHARVVVPLDAGVHALSSLPFLAARNAVGPVERDLANGGGDPMDGAGLAVLGAGYPDGIGVAQDSAVRFALAGAAHRLSGAVAVDDETPDAAAVAVVRLDGVEVLRREVRGSATPQPILLDLVGASVLELATEPSEDGAEAHVDWLSMRVHVE
ncbi:MAG: glycoside hydrolase family 97 catalytic domain-containing protein [Protaetiibacter sp.]